MTISATAVGFDGHMMWVDLTEGRILSVPLAWFPRLLRAGADARQKVEISRIGRGRRDEDISIAGLIAGRCGRTRRHEH